MLIASETLKTMIRYNSSFKKVKQGKTACQSRILYPAKLSFENKVKEYFGHTEILIKLGFKLYLK